jgi:transposase
MGTKRSLLVDGRGVPLSVVVSGANTHDMRLLEKTLDAAVAKKRRGCNLCMDAGYRYEQCDKDVRRRGMIPHIRPRSDETRRGRGRKKARRWVVERTASWLNQFRKIRIRYEKLDVSHMGLLNLCCAMITWRQVIIIYG